jgi:hypothetical protein
MNAVRCPSKVVKCIASGFQRCAARHASERANYLFDG